MKYLIKAYQNNPVDIATRRNLLACLYELGRIKVLTNSDDYDYIDELAENEEGKRIIDNEIKLGSVRESLEKLFKE